MPSPFLLVAFRFPPYDRIGAYRWAKLCGRLARRGHAIDVITVRWHASADPGWFGDVLHDNIRIHRTVSLYPHELRGAQPGSRVLQKAQGKLFHWLDAVTPEHDVASLWGYRLLPLARRLLDTHETRLVVATGAPFSSNWWAARLRCERRDTRLIQDFRDPWLTSHEELWTSPWRERFELATTSADMLVSVTAEMTALYQTLSGHERVATVPNGVELAELAALPRPESFRYDFAYIGNLFNRREETLEPFLEWMRRRQRAGKDVPRLAIAGPCPGTFPAKNEDLIARGQLTLKPLLPQRQAFELLLQSKTALHLNGPGAVGSFQTTTKLVEHAGLGRPTLSLNYGGAADTFIRQRRLGHSLRADAPDLFDQLDACWNQPGPKEFEVSDFDFSETARRYSELIDEVAAPVRR